MNQRAIESKLEGLNIDMDKVDVEVKNGVYLLYNLIEDLSSTNRDLQVENQKLRDEINRLKGEQGKPNVKPKNNGSKEGNKDISSEKERNHGKEKDNNKRNREPKVGKIKKDRTEICHVDKENLPSDAVFKGYESVIVQDIKIETDNIEFQKEIYYSPSHKKTYSGKVPRGYEGEYGPNVKAMTVIMKYVCNMSEPKILEFFKNVALYISGTTISNMLIKDKEIFHKEKEEIYKSGLRSTIYQQIDDTSARVNGENHYTHIVCNDLYTAYFTTKRKDRLTIIDVLRGFESRSFCFNAEAFKLLKELRVSNKVIRELELLRSDDKLNEAEIHKTLDGIVNVEIGSITRVRILEATAIGAYRAETGAEVVKVLVCDDAPQFKLITEDLGLCWVHEGRHYKKLMPIISEYKRKVSLFLEQYWGYYKKLLRYQENPSEDIAKVLDEEFDRIFWQQTGYRELDERILKTFAKKEEMLKVLKYPEIPLHNNGTELEARVQVRLRDVSLQTKTDEGTKAKDTFLSVIRTAKKLGVNAYKYISDRISRQFKMTPLSDIIRSKTEGLSPG